MKRVAICAYYWPPAGGPGVQRFVKFSKYLRAHGWEPIIITPANGSYPYLDEDLAKEVPGDIQVIRTKTFEIFGLYNRLSGKKGKSLPVGMTGYGSKRSFVQRFARYVRANFFIPDARVGWWRYARRALLRLHNETPVDALITTGPPHSAHLIGLRKTLPGLPWIADFRDPWTSIYYNKFLPRSPRTIRVDHALETKVLQGADLVITVSKGMAEEFRDRARKVQVIPNGFDAVDLPIGSYQKNAYFKLRFIGNLKANQNASGLWRAIAALHREHDAFQHSFRLELTGAQAAEVREQLSAAGILDLVHFHDFVPHQEATALMCTADVLLLVIPETPGNEKILTGKLFEYLGSTRPMISIGPTNGDAARILADAGQESMLDYDDQVGCHALLSRLWNMWLSDELQPVSSENLNKYSRQGQAKMLAEYLNETMK